MEFLEVMSGTLYSVEIFSNYTRGFYTCNDFIHMLLHVLRLHTYSYHTCSDTYVVASRVVIQPVVTYIRVEITGYRYVNVYTCSNLLHIINTYRKRQKSQLPLYQ